MTNNDTERHREKRDRDQHNHPSIDVVTMTRADDTPLWCAKRGGAHRAAGKFRPLDWRKNVRIVRACTLQNPTNDDSSLHFISTHTWKLA